MKASTYLPKTLKDQLHPDDLEYIDTLQHGSSNRLKEMVTDAAVRIIESRKYPKEAMNIEAGRDVNIAGRDVSTNTDGNQEIFKKVLIGILVTLIWGIIVYAVTQGF